MRMFNNSLKKLRDATAYVGAAEEQPTEKGDENGKAKTPKTPKKRKAAKGDGEESPTPKKRVSPKKKAVKIDQDVAEGEDVKAEASGAEDGPAQEEV
jgi:hypothetical protein